MKARILLFEDGNFAIIPPPRTGVVDNANLAISTKIQVNKKNPIAVYEGNVPDDVHEKALNKRKVLNLTKGMKKVPVSNNQKKP
jgi:hypothetical protein